MRSSTVGMFDMTDMAVDRADNALHGAHSTDQFVADTLNTLATANSVDIANTAGTEHPRMDRSRGHIPVPEGRARLRQANPKVRPPRKTPSSDCLLLNLFRPMIYTANSMPDIRLTKNDEHNSFPLKKVFARRFEKALQTSSTIAQDPAFGNLARCRVSRSPH